MVLEWENAFRPLRDQLSRAGLSPEEQFAVIYSWLVGENLGELFAVAGLAGDHEAVKRGLVALDSCLGGWPVSVKVGTNAVQAPDTSVSVVARLPDAGAQRIELELRYDAAKAMATGAFRRDLTATGWDLRSDCDAQGVVRLWLTRAKGQPPGGRYGSIAHVRLRLKPGAAGMVLASVARAVIDGKDVPAEAAALEIGEVPVIGPLKVTAGEALWAVGGTPPYSWEIVEDRLPAGLLLQAETGRITGQLKQGLPQPFRVRVTDSAGRSAQRWYCILEPVR